MHAANRGQVLVVPRLLEAGADPNIRAPDGATALFIAALHGHAEIVDALTAAGGDPTIAGPKGRTAEQLVAARIVEQTYLGKPEALHAALRANESAAVIRILLDGGANVASRIKLPDERFPDISEFYTPLHTAARYSKRPDAVALLLDGGARLDEEVEHQYGDEPPQGHGVTALGLALSVNEDPAVAMYLIGLSGGVEAEDKSGSTPLQWAAFNKQPDAAALLIDQGASVNAPGTGNQTPLFSAAQNPNVEVARLLIDHGAKVNWSGDGGWTPLHAAVMKDFGNLEVAELLLERGANVEASATHFASPLHLAATDGNLAAARLLHGYRTETAACFPLGESLRCGEPVCWAGRTEHNEAMITFLLDKGAEQFPELFLDAANENARCMFEVLTKHLPYAGNRAAAASWLDRNGLVLPTRVRPSSNNRTQDPNSNSRLR
jgi:ankyrin repeat protein